MKFNGLMIIHAYLFGRQEADRGMRSIQNITNIE